MIGLKWGWVPSRRNTEGDETGKLMPTTNWRRQTGGYQPELSMDSMTFLVQAVDGRAHPMDVSQRTNAAKTISLGSLRDKASRQHAYLV